MHIREAGDLIQRLSWVPERGWYIVCYDTFEESWYPALDKNPHMAVVRLYSSEAQASEAAHELLHDIERTQPSKQSGGQAGIQDRVFLLSPRGKLYRFFPDPTCRACPQ